MKCFATLAAIVIPLALAACNNDPRLVIPAVPDTIPSEPGDYEGSATCRTCHQSIQASWEGTRHARLVLAASLSNVVNDADGNGVNDFVQGGPGATFDVATSAPAGQSAWQDFALATGVTFPRLGFDGTNLLIAIGGNTYTVRYVLGGAFTRGSQRYAVTIGNQEYVVAVTYSPETRRYEVFEVTDWYAVDNDGTTLTGFVYAGGETPVDKGLAGNSWQRRFMGREVTGLRDVTKNADGEFGDTIAVMQGSTGGPHFNQTDAACEACHGPSARHVDLGGGIGTSLNPATMAAQRADETCGQCHSRGVSRQIEELGYPWKDGPLVDGQFQPGKVLARFQETVPRDDTGFFWPNGARSARLSMQQWSEHVDSAHARAGVACWQCHDPHGSEQTAGLRAAPRVLCMTCHDGQGDLDSSDLAKHTRHAGVTNCTNCHFVGTARSGVPGDTRSHTYRVIYPVESDAVEGLPNSCAECHRSQTPSELTSWLRVRWPEIKPAAYVTASLRSSGGYTLRGSGSLDPLGGPLTYEWAFLSGPPTFAAAQLIAPTSDSAIFVPTNPGIYSFQLVVINLDGRRSTPAVLKVEVEEGVSQTPPDLADSRYMGSSGCAICHGDVHDEWLTTRHKRSLRSAKESGAVLFADTNNNGLDDWEEGGSNPSFNLRTDADANNTGWDDVILGGGVDAPLIGYDSASDTYRVTIGAVTYDISYVIGGTGAWDQQYLATSDDGEYVLAFSYNELARSWDVLDPENWYDIVGTTFAAYRYGAGDTPVTEGRTDDSFQRRCLTCHVTGARDMTRNTATGEYALPLATMLSAATGPRIAELGTGCESCHGPGSQHMTVSTGGTGSPSIRGAIINPQKLPSRRANEACGQCHSGGTSANSAPFGFPWGSSAIDGHYIPGRPLDDSFTPRDETDSAYFWEDPDGHARLEGMEWDDMKWSRHFTEAGMHCGACHQPHAAGTGAQLRMPQNELCVRCHQGVTTDGGAAGNHSRHDRNSAANRCSTCHMPQVATAANGFDLASHQFRIIYPRTSTDVLIASGEAIPNSCMTGGCHGNAEGSLPAWDPNDVADNAQATSEINRLWGDIRPRALARIDAGGGLRREATVSAPGTIRLDGTKSFDPNGSAIVSYTWTLVEAPPNSSAVLLDRLSARARINVVETGLYRFRLVVRDALKQSRPGLLTVQVD